MSPRDLAEHVRAELPGACVYLAPSGGAVTVETRYPVAVRTLLARALASEGARLFVVTAPPFFQGRCERCRVSLSPQQLVFDAETLVVHLKRRPEAAHILRRALARLARRRALLAREESYQS